MSVDLLKRAAIAVYSELGYGYSESVYQHALEHELSTNHPQLKVTPQYVIRVKYRGSYVGTGIADFIIEQEGCTPLIVELKTGRTLNCTRTGMAQVLAYRRALLRRTPTSYKNYEALVISYLPHAPIIEHRCDEAEQVLDIPLQDVAV